MAELIAKVCFLCGAIFQGPGSVCGRCDGDGTEPQERPLEWFDHEGHNEIEAGDPGDRMCISNAQLLSYVRQLAEKDVINALARCIRLFVTDGELMGYRPLTSAYKSWLAEAVVGRPEHFVRISLCWAKQFPELKDPAFEGLRRSLSRAFQKAKANAAQQAKAAALAKRGIKTEPCVRCGGTGKFGLPVRNPQLGQPAYREVKCWSCDNGTRVVGKKYFKGVKPSIF